MRNLDRQIKLSKLKKEFRKAEDRIKNLPITHRKYDLNDKLGYGLEDYLYGHSINSQFDVIDRCYENIDQSMDILTENLIRINKLIDLHEKRLKEKSDIVISDFLNSLS